jgi:tetratricopeptide (TPR) repeat protein
MPTDFGITLGAGLFFVGWFSWLCLTTNVWSLARRTRVVIHRAHFVQLALQTTLFVYWSLYWDEVQRRAPLIAFQVVFAYLFELLLTWSRGKAWRLRLAPFPIVYSLNLFTWFKDEYFVLQLLMLSGAYLAKEFVTWKRGGRRSHIFNPSGLALAVTGVVLMATRGIGLTYGVDLTWSFNVPPHFYEVVFCLGLVVQFLFSTTWISCGTVATLWCLYRVAGWALGTPLAPQPFDPGVFLGLTLLVTDPMTSPRSPLAKFLFGVLYGVGIFGTYVALRLLQGPSYYDKILPIPVANLLVPWCDVAGARLRALSRAFFRRDLDPGWAGAIAIYVAVFLSMVGALKKGSEGFETPLPIHADQLSASIQRLRVNAGAFQFAHPEVYRPFAFREEWREYRRPSAWVPGTAGEHVALGRSYARVGRFDDALRSLQTAVRLDPRSADARLYLGNIYVRRGEFANAARHLEKALEFRPDDPKVHLNLGTAWGMMGRTREAIEQFRQTLAAEPNNTLALVNLGRLLDQQGDRKGGLGRLRQAVAAHPASVVAHWNLANMLNEAGEVDESRKHLRRVVFLSPDHAEARRLLMTRHAQMSRHTRAARHAP